MSPKSKNKLLTTAVIKEKLKSILLFNADRKSAMGKLSVKIAEKESKDKRVT